MEILMEIEITTNEGIKKTIIAVERTIQENGVHLSTKVFELTDINGSSSGEIAFHLENTFEWLYIGTELVGDEQDQIAEQISKYKMINS